MSVNEKGNLRPDGASIALPFLGLGGTYYWNPGSPSAPHVTLSGGLGMGGGGAHLVFLRKGMTSADSLGYGANAAIAPTIFPSVTVNASIPDDHGIPQPWNGKVSSIEAGASLPGFGVNYTTTPENIADFINKHIFGPAGEPRDELSPFERSLRRGTASVGPASEPPARFLRRRPANVLGEGMGNWSAPYLRGNATDRQEDADATGGPAFSGRVPAVPYIPRVAQGRPGGIPGLIAAATGSASSDPTQFQPPAGGILGMIQDYMNSNAMPGR